MEPASTRERPGTAGTARPSRSLPLGLLGAIVLIALIERGLSSVEAREWNGLTTVWAADWRLTGKAATRSATDSEILVFGDSLMKFGVIPRHLEDHTGLRAWNLALNVGQASSSYFLLRRALAGGARPRVILVNVKPNLLAEPVSNAERLWPEMIRPGEWLDLARSTRDPDLAARLMAASVFTSVRTRHELREAIPCWLRGVRPEAAHLATIGRRNWRVNRGAQIMNKVASPIDDAPHAPALYPASWRPDPVQAKYLRRFLRLAEDSGAFVALVIPPPVPSVHEKRESLGLEAGVESFLRGLAAEFPSLRVVDGRRAGYGPELHCDAVHLDRDGALRFSLGLGEIIAEELEGGSNADRWRTLPPIRRSELTDAGLVEDLAQSRHALRGDRGVVR